MMITENSDELAELILIGLMSFKRDGLFTPVRFSVLDETDLNTQLQCAKHLADYIIETKALVNVT